MNGIDAIGAQPAAHLDAVELGHHDVEQDQIGQVLAHGSQRLLAVRGGDDLVAVRRQPRAQDVDVGGVVVDDEDAGGVRMECKQPMRVCTLRSGQYSLIFASSSRGLNGLVT